MCESENQLKNEKQKAYVIREANIEPYLNKYLRKCKYVSKLTQKELDQIRRVEESYANHNMFSFLCNY